jgi:hypothetical protein
MRRAILFAVTLALVGATGPSAHAAVTPNYSVHYTFDGPALLADVSGNGHDLTPVSRHGGSYLTVPHGGGNALVFPPPCHVEPCPKIALRAVPAEDLNPGSRPIRFGAAVRLDPDETSKGENVLQKGYSASGSQWKLQVDGAEGKPSCVFVDDHRKGIHLALSSVSVADGTWHTLECRRAESQVTVLVDGVQRGGMTIPADLAVDNKIPLSVGGKGSFTNNDQFQGALDDVWVSMGQ